MPKPRGGHNADDPAESPERVRLQRYMAEAGVAARRVCEEMIEEGRVQVNGETVSTLPVFVDPQNDRVEVDGRLLAGPERKLYIMVNKPERVLVTAADEPGMDRPTVMDLVDHPARARLFPVGRLDYETTGLVLLTNDGELANRLTHPRFEVTKTYFAIVKGTPDETWLGDIRRKLRAGAPGEKRQGGDPLTRLGPGRRGGSARIEIAHQEDGRTHLKIELHEAGNAQVREVLRLLGLPVKKLTRIAIGPVTLTGVQVGSWRELIREEIQKLRKAASGKPPGKAGASGGKSGGRPRTSASERAAAGVDRAAKAAAKRMRPRKPGKSRPAAPQGDGARNQDSARPASRSPKAGDRPARRSGGGPKRNVRGEGPSGGRGRRSRP